MWDLELHWILDFWLHSSHQHTPNDISVHISQPSFGAVVIKGKPLVIEPEQVQDSGVQIVYGAHVFHRLVTELVGGAKAEAALHSGSSQPDREAPVINAAHG